MSERREKLEALLGPTGPQVTCEECFERLDEYVELELRARQPARAAQALKSVQLLHP